EWGWGRRRGRGENNALAKPNIIVEEINHRILVFDPIGNQIDAEAAQRLGKVGRTDVGRHRSEPIEQERRWHLDETETTVVQLAGIDTKIGEVIHRKAEAALGERSETGV